MFGTAKRFTQTVVPAVIKPLRVLWNEVIGFLFLSIAVISGFSWFRTWRAYGGTSDEVLKLVLTGLFTAVFAFFGLSSFWKARRISRS